MGKKVINGIIIAISIILIGFIVIFSLLPNVVLNVLVTIGGFIIPICMIIIAMIVEIKKEKNLQEKNKIRDFWLRILFIIYCILLITILFLNNEYRMTGFESININTFSREHFKTINIIPFSTIIGYINGLLFEDTSMSIVIINLVTNLLLLAPMGFFIPLLFKNKITNIKQFIILIIILLLFVEILQFITYRGSTDIDDIILNTIGAIIVYILMKTKLAKTILEKVFEIEE